MSNKFKNSIVEIIKESVSNINKENVEDTRLEIQRLFSELSSDMFQYNFLFTYGTLRRSQEMYNQIKALFGVHGIEYICSNRYDYKKIVDLGSYPALLDSKGGDKVVGDIIYLSDEAFAYVKDRMESEGFIEDNATLWIPSGLNVATKVKILSIPVFIAGDKLIKQIEDNKMKYPKIESGDWIRYQKQTSPYLTDTEVIQQIALWNDCSYGDGY